MIPAVRESAARPRAPAPRPASTPHRRTGRAPGGRSTLAPLPGAASLGVRSLLDGARLPAKVVAVFPAATYLEVHRCAEPRVLALVASDAVRLPNAIVVAAATRQNPFGAIREGDEAIIGDGTVDIAARAPAGSRAAPQWRLKVRVRRWWDPAPVLGPLSVARLARGAAALESATAEAPFGLAGHDVTAELAERCGAGDLAHAVAAAEQIVGLGPGLTPSGDDVLAGLLLSLRLLGGSVPRGGTAVWLADWLGAAVTADASTRTTALAATLLQCAAHGQAAGEVAAVLRGIAGQEQLHPAIRRLLGVGHTSGADLAWGLLAGCRAALRLVESDTGGNARER